MTAYRIFNSNKQFKTIVSHIYPSAIINKQETNKNNKALHPKAPIFIT